MRNYQGYDMESLTRPNSQPGPTSVSTQVSDSTEAASGAVLVVIPSFNEAEHIEGLVLQLLNDMGQRRGKIVIADGGSTDRTCAIVEKLAQRDSRVLLLDSRKRIAASINEAVSIHGGDTEFLIRIDAHAGYPPQYCAHLLATQSETAADSVVVSMLTTGTTCFQRAAAAAQNSFLGNGGSAHRNAPRGRWVDHGHHALMRIAAFKAVGGYDESFYWNEDAELDARLRASGFRLYLAAALTMVYFPRRTVSALFRQYFNYGRGRAANFLKHHERPRLRQVLPLAVAPALGMLLLAPAYPVFCVPAAVWFLSCVGFGVWLGIKKGELCAAASGFAAIVMHVGWSFGAFVQLAMALNTMSFGRRLRRTGVGR
jgi:succinoglycan biosynthesis protein ExoA